MARPAHVAFTGSSAVTVPPATSQDAPPAPANSSYVATAEAGSGAAAGPSSSPTTVSLACAGSSYITAVYSGGSEVDINLLGVRCSDGRGAAAGRYRPLELLGDVRTYTVEAPCPEGFDSVVVEHGSAWNEARTGSGISRFALRCSSAASHTSSSEAAEGNIRDSDSRFWTHIGAARIISMGGTLFAATEALVNARSGGSLRTCPDFSIVSQLTVAYVVTEHGTDIRRVDFYCSPRPPPPRDSSFFDIAARYGIALSALLGANPAVDASQPLAMYSNTQLTIPLMCGSSATQPPVHTISAKTCGTIATTFLSRNLNYLNTVNNGMCPSAATKVARGVRLCIAPPSAVTAVTGAGAGRVTTRRRLLLVPRAHGSNVRSGLSNGAASRRALLQATAADPASGGGGAV
ncbi:hypothetical protein HXX76_001909 [Chlamydomonas incerta]|uniref:LysM domain-containing protein n=1 Tax=Chlamydomonas incerta TaxID=51695 RepID=A0A836B040_CHLIN|nr:hypothetical protein HXX76_001909 [Chlamydomonas incerta]|eukprot:KAG2443557.1 hypothetical protein HXX76_001909 [Chlamydomonas incerta]